MRRRRRRRRVSAQKLTFASAMRRNRAKNEKVLFDALKGARLKAAYNAEFRTQVHIAGFIADCCFDAFKLVIEADGSYHIPRDDAIRDLVFLRQGYLTLRFTNDEIGANVRNVVWQIENALASRGTPWEPLALRKYRCEEALRRVRRYPAPSHPDALIAARVRVLKTEIERCNSMNWQEQHEIKALESERARKWWWPPSIRRLDGEIADAEARANTRIRQLRTDIERKIAIEQSDSKRAILLQQYEREKALHDASQADVIAAAAELSATEELEANFDDLEYALSTCAPECGPIYERPKDEDDLLSKLKSFADRFACDEDDYDVM